MTTDSVSASGQTTGHGCPFGRDVQRGKRLHLLDLDNLHGSGNPRLRRIDRVRRDFDRLGFQAGDLVYGACMHEPARWNSEHKQRVARICKVWPKGTVRPVAGRNGADRALVGKALEYVDHGRITWFDDVVIASGDHLFKVAADRIRRVGVTVHLVVRNENSLSADLRNVVDGCIWHLGEQRCLRHSSVIDMPRAA